MKIDSNIKQVIGVIITALLILLFYSKSTIDKDAYYNVITKLNKIKEYKNRLFGNVFLTRYNQIKHYDIVQEDMKHIFELSSKLNNNISKTNNKLSNQWKQYLIHIEEINNSLNNFMSHNAILKSFIVHYPKLGNELYTITKSQNRPLSIEILKMQNYILALNSQNKIAKQSILVDMQNRILPLSSELKTEEKIRVNHFLLYSSKILFYSKQMKILENEFIQQDINKEINNLIFTYNNYYRKIESNSNIHLFAMMILSFGLLAWIVIFIKNLKTANYKIKRSVMQLEKTNKQLYHSNKELKTTIDELENTQGQLILSEKMASLGELVAGITHEVNTPIGLGVTATTHLSVLTKEINHLFQSENISKEELDEYLYESLELTESIHYNLSKAAYLMKSFKQVAVDQASDQKRVFNVKTYLNEIYRNLKHKIKRKNFKFIVNCDEKIELKSFPGPFSQIITNLIMNSIIHGFKYTDDGNISISVQEHANNLVLLYRDNGMGIQEKHLEKIYDPFFTTNKDQGGSGLGLNIIYNIIVTKLNGTIHCTSKEDEGVLFKIIIPT